MAFFKTTPENKIWVLSGELDNEAGSDILIALRRTVPGDPVIFHLNSDGGDALLALSLAHELCSSLPKLHTRAIGYCASAAVDLLEAGALRTSTPYTTFCTHAMQGEQKDLTYDSALQFAIQFKTEVALWINFIKKRAGNTTRFWTDFFSKERWFDAKEAKRLNLIDKIY